MKIILTHEQADFDAVASLLGAHLLEEVAIPVLPRRMNRNVRAFLNLYGVELAFVEARDLGHKQIDSITLVDTQSLVSLKGMNTQTRVHVIDHHPLKDDLPSQWEITVSGTGANTTIFVETLRERDIVLTTVESTLLLLGIYEDTGSLTYTRTTARDLRAASYLLEQGASLQIDTDFLNHPLSASQQTIYDQLRAGAQAHSIHGHTVILACGEVLDVNEELSTVVHKLRDLLDPDALIVLITT
jgi:tRNA nucleotidyltransferase (CCA-adding enzyme)